MSVVVRRYIDILIIIITFPYSTCSSSFFWLHHPYFFVHFLNVFSFLLYFEVAEPLPFFGQGGFREMRKQASYDLAHTRETTVTIIIKMIRSSYV